LFKRGLTTRVFRTRVLPILRLLAAGNYPAKIARVLGMSRSHVHYYLRRLEKAGWIKRTGSRWPVFYSVSEDVQRFLDGVERGFCDGRRILRLHNVVFKFPVLREPCRRVDWRRVELVNWSQFVGRECGVTVRKNTGSVEVFCDVVEGRNPYELLWLAFEQACRVAAYLESKFGMRLGFPRLSRKPHFGVYDLFADFVGKYYEFSSDFAKVDESEGFSELDILDPGLANDYVLMPRRLRKIEKKLEMFESLQKRQILIMETFAKAMEEHRALINEIQKLVKQLKNLI